MERILNTWAGLASHLIGECFDVAKPYIDKAYEGLDPKIRFVTTQLYIDCHLTSESVLLLVREGKEWDADLVNRSVTEGSLKYVFMLLGTQEEISCKVREYWDVLPSFAAIRRSERLKQFLEVVPNPDAIDWEPLREMILDEDRVNAIRGGYTRADRAGLEEKWSFAGISREFIRSDSQSLKLLGYLAHGYGMSSHLLHKDGDGVGMVWDRYRREPDRQATVRLGHAARIVSDVCTFAKLRLLHLLKACGADTAEIPQIDAKYQLLNDEIAKAGAHFSRVEYGKGG
jgi:hypothetical protein